MKGGVFVSGLAALVLVATVTSAAAQQADADRKELAEYRLTSEGLDRYSAVLRALVGELRKDPRFQEMAKVEAEIRRLDSKDDPTDEEVTRLDELEERLAQLEESTDLSMSDGSLADIEAQIRKNPAMAAAVKAGGFTPREYAKFTLTLFQASMAVGMQKAGLLKEMPKDIPPENVAFVQQHEQQLAKLQQEMEALAPSGRGR